MQVYAHTEDGRAMVVEDEIPTPLSLARVVNIRDATVGPEVKIGSIVAQAEPGEWTLGPGEHELLALEIATP